MARDSITTTVRFEHDEGGDDWELEVEADYHYTHGVCNGIDINDPAEVDIQKVTGPDGGDLTGILTAKELEGIEEEIHEKEMNGGD